MLPLLSAGIPSGKAAGSNPDCRLRAVRQQRRHRAVLQGYVLHVLRRDSHSRFPTRHLPGQIANYLAKHL